ncbi:MAG: DUF4145 domain-containing protein [Methyloceanibacter sp.]
MATIKHQCPHCLVQDIALVVVAWSPLERNRKRDDTAGVALLVCPRCSLPSGTRLKRDYGDFSYGQLGNFAGDPTTVGWSIAAFWPDPPKPLIPEYLPPDIERVYLQAERNFTVPGNEEASGTMYRKALDVGCKKIDPGLTGTLGAKIKALAAKGKLTKDIEEWSDQVRELGNDAAHEEAALPRKDLEDLRGIAEMVLRYLFTLPNMIKKRRGEKLPWEP